MLVIASAATATASHAVTNSDGTDSIAAAVALYNAGQPNRALTELVQKARDESLPQATRLALLELVMDKCTIMENYSCLLQNIDLYNQISNAVVTDNKYAISILKMKRNYYNAVTSYRGNNKINSDKIAKDFLSDLDEYSFIPEYYIKSRLFLATIFAEQENVRDSQIYIDQTMSYILSIKNPEEIKLQISMALSKIIELSSFNGDNDRAIGIHSISHNFIKSILLQNSFESGNFYEAEAYLFEQIGNLELAIIANEKAIRSYSLTDAPSYQTILPLSSSYNYKALFCIVIENKSCVEEAIENHPIGKKYNNKIKIEDYNDVTSIVTLIFAKKFIGKYDEIENYKNLLNSVNIDKNQNSSAKKLEIYRLFGIGIASENPIESKNLIISATKKLTDYVKSRNSSNFGSWYRTGIIDQIILNFGLAISDHELSDSLSHRFDMVQLLSRKNSLWDSDALSILSATGSSGERSAIHQALRLKARRDKFERIELASLIQLASNRAYENKPIERDYKKRVFFATFSRNIDEAISSIDNLNARKFAPSLEKIHEVQKALSKDEVVLAEAAILGNQLTYICVRSNFVWSGTKNVDFDQLERDRKILQLALTSGHAPNDSLDSQYPVEAALRTYQVLIGPAEGCLKSGDTVFWLGQTQAIGVPLSALLDSLPSKNAAGYDLQNASWLVRRFSFAYIGSAGVLVNSRNNLGKGTAPSFDFLGVGNPTLSGRTVDGVMRSTALLKNVRSSTGLKDLAELPETETELVRSAKPFRRSTLLTGDKASEQSFRQQLLGSYRYISFATHGLLRDDVYGLSEPALVLTPIMASEGYNDGLLTAGEIADLNLNADFVALSACNTANFDVAQFSTDLPALTSAMAIAGVPSTLATLWPVDSEAASQIVARTFELSGAKDEPSSARALAASQREFLHKDMKAYNYHPRFWSPFVIFGDNKKNNTKEKIAREEPQDVKVQALGGSGTEGLSLIQEKDEFFSRYISDSYNGRLTSSVANFDFEGKNLWKSSSKEVGASKLLVKLNNGVIVGGYVSGFNDSMIGIIESYDHKEGKLLKTFSVKSDQGLNIFAASALRISADVAYISFIENGVGISKPTGTPIVRIISVDRDFHIREIAKIDLPNELLSGLLDTSMSLNPDGGIVISVNNRMPNNFDFRVKRLDEFWSIPCMPQPKTYLYGFSKDMRLKSTSVLDGINIEKIILNDDKIIVAGSRKYECTKDAKGFIGELNKKLELYKIIFSDKIFGESIIKDIIFDKKESYFILNKIKTLDVYNGPSSINENGTFNYDIMINDTSKIWNSYLIKIDKNVDRYFQNFDAGISIHLNSLIKNGNNIILSGYNDINGLIYIVKLSN